MGYSSASDGSSAFTYLPFILALTITPNHRFSVSYEFEIFAGVAGV
jgi:hypothetical protein